MFRLTKTVRAWVLMSACALSGATLVQPASARPAPKRETSEFLIESSGKVLFAKSPDAPHRPASLTKMMTLYLAFDALDAGTLRLDDSVPISLNAARQPPSKLGIPAGKSLSVRTALQVMVVHSANDVTVALAEKLGGTEAKFARTMTAKARALGMLHTSFANASGLTNPGNETTARDMSILAFALLRDHPREYPIFAQRSVQWGGRRILSHDHLLGKVAGVDGLKTGFTDDAGYNIVTSAKRGGVRIVAVVLGAKSVQARDVRVANLVELGFTPFGSEQPRRVHRRRHGRAR